MRDVRGYFAKHRAGVLLLVIVFTSMMLMSLTSEASVLHPKQISGAVVSILQRAVSQVGGFARNFFASIGELSHLRTRYEELQNELLQYRRDARELIQLRRENTQLRELLAFSAAIPYDHVAARVIGNDPSQYFNSLVIDRGLAHGMEIDMPVVAYQDGFQGLVGKIASVSPLSSLVLPVYDANCFVPARLQGSRFTGLIQGSGNRFSFLSMTYVPKSARDHVTIGDLVATSGLSTIYPSDIYVGRVRSITAKSWEASLTLELEPVVDFSRIEYVFVIDLVSEGAE
jgi:rod shape-determining protein MreC